MTMPDRRQRLLKLLSDIEQQISEAENLTIDAPDDEILRRASEQLAELRRVRAEVEQKVLYGDANE